MSMLQPLSRPAKPRIGLYTVGLKAYWDQFHGLRERLIAYGEFIKTRMSEWGDVYFYGLVDDSASGRQAGEWFNERNVDIVFCHSGTYITSDSVLPVHLSCKAPAVLLNLQPTAQINYKKTTTGEWLANCGACPVPEITYACNRAGIDIQVINGLLGMPETYPGSLAEENTADRPESVLAWKEISEYIRAAGVKRMLKSSRFGFLGGNYSGMLDMYNDFTMYEAVFGLHVEILEMCDLAHVMNAVTPEEVAAKRAEIDRFFVLSDAPVADSIASIPTEEQLNWSATVAAAQERFVKERKLDALTYYYHGADNNEYEQIQSGFIVGHSLLTARSVPCAGEGDMKTDIAMKICDTLGVGGSYSEIVTVDYLNSTILLGHDGPFHIAIADGTPILRGMGVYHGKKGAGISVEAKVKNGPVTTLGLTQQRDGKFKFIISEGVATDEEIMTIGNTQTQVDFGVHPDRYMDKWFREAPPHHCSMSVGHNKELFLKVAKLLGVDAVVV